MGLHLHTTIAHAEYMQFPKRLARKRSVITLGGDEKIMQGFEYDCRIQDLGGRIYRFSAQGIESITGALNSDIDEKVVERMFLGLEDTKSLVSVSEVDYLIGHPGILKE